MALVQAQGAGCQHQPLGLHRAALFDAAGADGGGDEGRLLPRGTQLAAGVGEAEPEGRLEALGSGLGRQVADAGAFTLGENLALRRGQPAAGVGLAGIEAGEQST